MGSFRFRLFLPGLAFAVLYPHAAHGQLDDRTIASIMRECRKIADEASRAACYDNIPLGQQSTATSEVAPPAPTTPAPHPAEPSAPQTTTAFGSNQLPPSPQQSAQEAGSITATVATAVERERGIYLLTLEDGAQWLFVDGVPASYDPPGRGSDVVIYRASMGSYLLRYAGQRGIRIRRVK